MGLAQAVRVHLGADHDCVLWNDAHVFRAGEQPIESLERVGGNSQFAVFVATADDVTILRGDVPRPSVRDNVLVEYTLFIGALGRHRCFFLIPRADRDGSRFPTDLVGLTMFGVDDVASDADPVTLQRAVATACQKVEVQIAQLRGEERRRHREASLAVQRNSTRGTLGSLAATIVALRGIISDLQRAILENVQKADRIEAAKVSTVKSIRKLTGGASAKARELGVGGDFEHLVEKAINLVESAPAPVRLSKLLERLVAPRTTDLAAAAAAAFQDGLEGALSRLQRETLDAIESTKAEYGSWWDRASAELRDAADAAANAVDRRREELLREMNERELRRLLPSSRLSDLDFDA